MITAQITRRCNNNRSDPITCKARLYASDNNRMLDGLQASPQLEASRGAAQAGVLQVVYPYEKEPPLWGLLLTERDADVGLDADALCA